MRAANLVVVAITLAFASSARGEVVQEQGIRASVAAAIKPNRLPRRGVAPIAVSLSTHVYSVGESRPPQLRKIVVAINSHAFLREGVQPRCGISRISPATSRVALKVCRPALVGQGQFSADVRIPSQTPFPSRGRLLAFNGMYRGSPAILAHIYGTKPFPTSFVLPFTIRRRGAGTYGTILSASLPSVTGEAGFVNGISLTLNGSSPGGQGPGYVTAGCPAPQGFSSVVFPLARCDLFFAGGLQLRSVLNSTCRPL